MNDTGSPNEQFRGELRAPTAITQHATRPEDWVGLYSDYLYSFAFSRLQDPDAARDLVQDTFLSALQKISQFEGRSSEKTWLTAILKNKITDVYRKKASGLKIDKNVGFTDHDEQDFFDAETGHWTALHAPRAFGIESFDPLIQKELGDILRQCLQKLPGLWFSVFTMKHVDDEDTNTICTINRITPSNFWVIMHRAKVNLRACVQKNWKV